MIKITLLLILAFINTLQSNPNYDVLFVIGGPGSGKGT